MKNFKRFFLQIFTLVTLVFFSSCEKNDTEKADELFKSKDYQTAITHYSTYIESHPNDEKSFYNRGRAYEELGELEKAKENFMEAANLEPNNITFQMSLGIIYFKLKKFSSVVSYMENILKLKSNDAHAFLLKGRAYQRLGKIRDAMESYDNAIRYDSKLGGAYLYRGILKASTKKNGCDDLKKAKALKEAEADDLIKKYCR